MEGTLICHGGRRLALPDLLEWRLEYTGGVPCDSFSLTCLWSPKGEGVPEDAVRFLATQGGETVFSGVVDECGWGWDTAGATLTVAGRGLAGLLLDNEAPGVEYQVATLADILRDYVTPYGIGMGEVARLPPVPGFAVEAGSSAWQALYSFCRYYGGLTPRFDRAGRLVIAPWKGARRLVLDDKSPIVELRCTHRRYGVLSEVLVRDRVSGAVQRVENLDFQAQGGACRRVLTMPGRSSYQAMRYSGQYQLERSADELRQVELTLPWVFAAWPGDLVEIKRSACPGLWRVAECATGVGRDGGYSRLVLRP